MCLSSGLNKAETTASQTSTNRYESTEKLLKYFTSEWNVSVSPRRSQDMCFYSFSDRGELRPAHSHTHTPTHHCLVHNTVSCCVSRRASSHRFPKHKKLLYGQRERRCWCWACTHTHTHTDNHTTVPKKRILSLSEQDFPGKGSN